MSFELYCIKNHINDKIYIGQTIKGYRDRWIDHLSFARTYKRKSKLYNAMRKYGVENFYVNLICSVENIEELNELEEFLISETQSNIKGYNIRPGGNNSTLSDSTKIKLSNINKGKKLSEETKRKISKASKRHFLDGKLTGLVMKEKGFKQTEEIKMKISNAHKGRKHSDSDRERHILNLLNYVRTEESERIRLEAVRKANNKKVNQYTLNMDYIKTWPSIKSASNETGICYQTITSNIKGRRKTGKGFMWRFADE